MERADVARRKTAARDGDGPAHLSVERGNPSQAVEILQALAQLPQPQPGIVAELARALLAAGRPEEAIRALEERHRGDPSDAESWSLLAVAYGAVGRDADVGDALLVAARLDPTCDAWVRLSDHYQRHGNIEGLRTWLAQVEAAPLPCRGRHPCTAYHSLLGRLHANVGNVEEAKRHAQNGPFFAETVKRNYLSLYATLQARGTPLVAVQYATWPVEGLTALFPNPSPGVVFVDNEPSFGEAIALNGYNAMFLDHTYGGVGHGTRAGNALLAKNVATGVLTALAGGTTPPDPGSGVLPTAGR